jgi:DNA-binding MarR family transcriptional regulator
MVERDSRRALFAAIEALQRLAELMDRRRRQLAEVAGLTDPQWQVLEQIGRDDFLPSLFARSRECSAAAVSRTLRQLLERDLVAVSISQHDARRREYAPTPKGRRVLEELHERRERALDAVWADFSRDELERFVSFGAELADRLERYAAGVEGGRTPH